MENIFLFDFKDYLDALIKYIYDDIHKGNSNWLRAFINGDNEFLRKSTELFGRGVRDKNKIQTTLELPNNPNSLPCITLRCPQGSLGDSDIIMHTNTVYDQNLNGRDVFRSSMSKQFDFMCVGKNYEESYIISEVLRGLFIGSIETLANIMKCEKANVTTKDLYMESDMSPNVFVRLVTLNVQIPEEIPSIVVTPSITNFNFNQKVVE
ncbi:MAG: hypothetical protein ACRDD8_09110 [Bacteroidales bacterium]